MSAMTEETWYKREIVTDQLRAFGLRLRQHFGVPAEEFGTKGNEAHRVGRHRSLEWNLNSEFATRRNYGTRDSRDTKGNARHIRAFDLGLPRLVLFEVSRNVENAVADGRAYMLAEWYGDLGDDNTVDGWFEGHDSTSDSSHKTHFHGGLWTIYADDEQALSDLFDIMTGADMTPSQEYMLRVVNQRVEGILSNRPTIEHKAFDPAGPDKWGAFSEPNPLAAALARPPVQPAPVDQAQLDAAVKAAVRSTLLDPEFLAAVAKAVADEDHRRSAE